MVGMRQPGFVIEQAAKGVLSFLRRLRQLGLYNGLFAVAGGKHKHHNGQNKQAAARNGGRGKSHRGAIYKFEATAKPHIQVILRIFALCKS
jgi:hypothetical protein